MKKVLSIAAVGLMAFALTACSVQKAEKDLAATKAEDLTKEETTQMPGPTQTPMLTSTPVPTSTPTPISTPTPTSTEVPHVHSYKETITREATSTEDGEITYVCECGDTYTEVIKATGYVISDDEDNHNATYEVDGYLAQADQYLEADDPVSAMKVIVDAIYECGKDTRLVAKADDIRSHTFVTSKEVYIQSGDLGANPVPDQMVLEYEIRKNYDENGAWTSSTTGINYINADSEGLPEGWVEYSVSSDVPADENGLCQSSLYRVSYDAQGRISRIIRRWDANISWKYNLLLAGGESYISTYGPYQVREFQYDEWNRVTEYRRYYVDSDETTLALSTNPKEFNILNQYVYGADGSRTEYEMSGAYNSSTRLYPGTMVYRLAIVTYNSVGQMTDYKFYLYSGDELWISVEECMAKGQLLTHDTYSYPTAYQRELNGIYKSYGETEYKTHQSMDERIGSELEVDEQGNLVPSFNSIDYDGFSYTVERDATGRLLKSKCNWTGGGETVTYSYNKAGKITEQTAVTRDGQWKYATKRKVTYTSDGGFTIETFDDGTLAFRESYDRFGNRTQYLDYNDWTCDWSELNNTYNYDGSILSNVTIRHEDGKYWITGDFCEYDYFGNILMETGAGTADYWSATYFYQFTYHYDPNHFIPQGYDIR